MLQINETDSTALGWFLDIFKKTGKKRTFINARGTVDGAKTSFATFCWRRFHIYFKWELRNECHKFSGKI